MTISAKELAKKLNISPATVSMVLNNKYGISDATRERVLNAAHEYGFDFTKLDAKSSSTGIIQLIIYKKDGMVVSDTPFFSQLIEGINHGCTEQNFVLQITYFYENMPTSEQIENINKSDCNGILLLGTEMSLEDFDCFSLFNKPIIILDTYFNELNYDFVKINNVRGMYSAVEYLISNGFKNIGYLRSSYEISNFVERFDGYCKAMNKHAIPINTEYIHNLTPTADGAYSDMKKITELDTEFADAYVADNDLIASGSIRAFKENGIKIPEDISVIGFDNMPMCDILEPPLSTVDVPKQKLGIIAVYQLVKRIKNHDDIFTTTEISPTLYIRKSVK